MAIRIHVKQDAGSKLVVKYKVTDASVHDSQATDYLPDEKDKGEDFYAGYPHIVIIHRRLRLIVYKYLYKSCFFHH